MSGHMDAPTTRVGSRCTTARRIGGREREVSTEITEYDPPRRWADRGIDGPIRAIVAVTVEPLADRSRSRLTIELDFTGHGIGKLLGAAFKLAWIRLQNVTASGPRLDLAGAFVVPRVPGGGPVPLRAGSCCCGLSRASRVR